MNQQLRDDLAAWTRQVTRITNKITAKEDVTLAESGRLEVLQGNLAHSLEWEKSEDK
jgi:hypothetical protein